MAKAFNYFNALSADLPNKVHNLGSDAITVFLTNTVPEAGNSVLTDITEIDYTNCSSRVVTVTSSEQTDGDYKLIVEDLELTASGGDVGPFRYVGLYNDTATNDPLIGWYDYGSELTLGDGESIKLDFSQVDGVLQLNPAV